MTTATPTVTRVQAEAVLAAICKRYSSHLDGFTITGEDGRPITFPGEPECNRPHLVENYEGWHGSVTPWAVVWESGDFEWAYRACGGGLNEEIASVLRHEFGLPRDEVTRRATEEPVEHAPAIMLEPVNSYTVGIFPA